jgi:hypothetical protein
MPNDRELEASAEEYPDKELKTSVEGCPDREPETSADEFTGPNEQRWRFLDG